MDTNKPLNDAEKAVLAELRHCPCQHVYSLSRKTGYTVKETLEALDSLRLVHKRIMIVSPPPELGTNAVYYTPRPE